jgi:hypothetical protein
LVTRRRRTSSCDDVADADLDQVAAAKLAVDGGIEQRPTAQPSMLIKP